MSENALFLLLTKTLPKTFVSQTLQIGFILAFNTTNLRSTVLLVLLNLLYDVKEPTYIHTCNLYFTSNFMSSYMHNT